MFSSKRKNIVALATVALVLMAGVGTWQALCRRGGTGGETGQMKKQEEKLPARVGQIFIIGNKKISDKAILEQVNLFPGQSLTFPDLCITERNLSRLEGLKSNPKVTVIDREDDGVFRDIEITVEEK